MIKKNLGNSNIKTSAIGLGTWAIGGGDWWGDTDEEMAIKTIQTAIDSGITLIDTAPCYGFGQSELVVGKAIKGYRDKVILSTKCGLWWHDNRGADFFTLQDYKVKRCLDPDTIKREIELSLERLDTDYIDIYFTHWQSVGDYNTPISDTMGCLMDLKRQGIIKSIGASNVNLDHIKEYQKYGELDVIQEKYSMLDRRLEAPLFNYCGKNNIDVMAYSPLEQGLLTGKITMDYVLNTQEARASIPWYKPENRIKVIHMLEGWYDLTQKYTCTFSQLVVAWTMSQENISYVLCGARKPEHILDTAASYNISLSIHDLERMRSDIVQLGEPI